MKQAFYVTCSCGSISSSNYVEVDDYGYGEMITVCTSCEAEVNRSYLCQDIVKDLLEEAAE